jgi:glycosyltransferase involved in cell wall biosynthesis
MRVLLVCPYPPIRDGIGAYAVQQATALRAQGHHVEVLSPLPSAAHHHLELRGWRGPLALAKRTPRYDRVILHFHADMFYPLPLSRREMVAVTLGLTAAFSRARELDLIIHEFPYNWGRRASVRQLVRTMLRSATHVLVHTATEKRLLCEAFALSTAAVTVIDHGSDFIRRTSAEPATARRLVGVPDDTFVFLAIGFVQPHKGFDRAIRAFADLGQAGCRLYVVGSIRVEEPEYLAHLADLRRLAAERPGVELRIEYVSDERFDEWLVAADVVVLPYRNIWSSSVLERARLYDRPVIASDVGGLHDQGYRRVVWVATDDELAIAMHEAAGHRRPMESAEASAREPFIIPPGTPRASVMEAVRRRASLQRRPLMQGAAPVAPAPEVAPLLRLGDLPPPSLASRSRSRRIAKRVINRALRWQTEPLRQQINALRAATLQVTESLAEPEADDAPDDGTMEKT